MFSYVLLHMDAQVWDKQLEPIDSGSVRTQEVAWKTFQKWWMTEKDGKREVGKSVLVEWHDDVEDIIKCLLLLFLARNCYLPIA